MSEILLVRDFPEVFPIDMSILPISKGGIVVYLAKVEVVLKWETFKSVFDIMKFLCLCGYYRWFIENFFRLALPLTKLTRKNQPFV
uniref:Uncharacterized protein n=1 Tax=Cajanus cajan TaxID=3821 RepID=A0A151SEN8_CAJCA|nr:hypothetical protein KK1_024824 [Cajanus cajan]